MDNYKLDKQIGSGTFGDVFKGTEIKTGMKVAIKRIRKKVLYENGKYLLQAYYREIEIMKKCACENSIKFIEEFPTENDFNIIMELCDTDLLVYLYERENTFTAEEIRNTFSQLNNAFRKMSENKILHRDLKLGNILIKFTDESKTNFIPKLTDYGFSKELNNYNYAASTHLGTPATMAPEIMMNRPYNEKSDLWSIGIMMYQLYYREVPFEGNSEIEILKKIQSNKRIKQPDDPNLSDLINKLLVVDDQYRLSWNEYFNHPFFGGNESGNNQKNSDELEFSPLSRTFTNDIERHLPIDKIEKSKTTKGDFGYSFSTNIFVNNIYSFTEGDIYGQKQKEFSCSTNLGIYSFANDKNFELKINLINRGGNINDHEYKTIIEACIESQDKNLLPLAQRCLENIKSKLQGQWFVFVCNEEDTNFDYFINTTPDNSVYFKYKKNDFQVWKLF